MRSSSRIASVALSAATLLGAVACSDSTGAGRGTVGVKLTNASVAAATVAADIIGEANAPLPAGSVKSVDIYVVRIDARQAEPSEAESAEATSDAEAADAGWVTIAEPNAVIDLMTLGNGETAFLGDAEVPAGAYNGFRLIIDPAMSSLTLNDEANTVIGGESITGLKFPSADKTGIKVNLTGPVDVADGGTSTVMVTFDVSKSFVMRGPSVEQNGLLFKPVIKGEQVQEEQQ